MSFSYPQPQAVIDEIGDDLVSSFIDSLEKARADFDALKETFPHWFPMTSRTTANFLHDRLWSHYTAAIADFEGVNVRDTETMRDVSLNDRYTFRLKRHTLDGEIRSYRTEAAQAYWANTVNVLEGLESVNLALGYTWDSDARAIGNAVLSLQDGLQKKPVWIVELQPGVSATQFTWTPVTPMPPEFDFSGLIAAEEDQKEAR